MHAIYSVLSLLIGVLVLLAGNGLLGTLLGVRGQLEPLSEAVLGVVMASYFAGFMVGTRMIPPLIRKIGHIRMFAALASVASVIALLHGLYVHPLSWAGLRLISGFCIVGLYIVIESWLHERCANEERGQVFSAYMTTTLIGLGLGQWLLVTGDPGRLELFAVASALLSLGLVPVAMTDVHEPRLVEVPRLGMRRLFEISPLGVVACVFAGIGAGAFWGMGPVFAAAIGLGAQGVAAFMGLTILGGVVMLWPVGRLSDRLPRRTVLTWTCVLASVGASLSALLTGHGSRVLLGGFAYGAFAFSMYSLAAAHTNDHAERSMMLEVTASLQMLWAAGAIFGPLVAGSLMQRFGPASLMLFIAVSALIPALFARYRMTVTPAIPIEDQGEFVPQFATSPAALEMLPESGDSDGELPEDVKSPTS